jgi:hypothetical protein
MTVRIDYEYRDAHGYGGHGAWTVPGAADQAALESTLLDGEFFVPDAVGMPMLCPGGGEWTQADHAFHTIRSVNDVDEPVDEDRSFDAILDAFRSADWRNAGLEHEKALT